MTRFTLFAAIALAMLTVCMIAGAAFFFTHHRSERVSARSAEAEFEHVRARFAGGRPTGAPLHSFHTMVFDTRGGERLVRMNVPYRLGRLFGRGSGFRWLGELTFLDDMEFDPEPIQLSLAQVERQGPGILADYRHPSGGQFIAWVE